MFQVSKSSPYFIIIYEQLNISFYTSLSHFEGISFKFRSHPRGRPSVTVALPSLVANAQDGELLMHDVCCCCRPRFLQQKSEDELEPPLASSDSEHFIRLVGDGWRRASSSAEDTPSLTMSTSSAAHHCDSTPACSCGMVLVMVGTVSVILRGHS